MAAGGCGGSPGCGGSAAAWGPPSSEPAVPPRPAAGLGRGGRARAPQPSPGCGEREAPAPGIRYPAGLGASAAPCGGAPRAFPPPSCRRSAPCRGEGSWGPGCSSPAWPWPAGASEVGPWAAVAGSGAAELPPGHSPGTRRLPPVSPTPRAALRGPEGGGEQVPGSLGCSIAAPGREGRSGDWGPTRCSGSGGRGRAGSSAALDRSGGSAEPWALSAAVGGGSERGRVRDRAHAV